MIPSLSLAEEELASETIAEEEGVPKTIQLEEKTQKPLVLEPLSDLEELISMENETQSQSTGMIGNLSKIEFLWKPAFQVQAFIDETTTNFVVSTRLYGGLKWNLTDEWSFNSQALFIGRVGFTQSIYDREDRSRGLYLLESIFNWKISPFYQLQFGQIAQDFLKAPLLVTDRTFPSIIFNYTPEEFYNFKTKFIVQSSIPDNAEESVRRETQIIKGVPSFVTISAYLESSKFPLPLKHYFSNYLTFFHYYNLSQAVAQRSRIYENTVDRTGSDSKFQYDYYGFHNHSNFKMVLSHFVGAELGFEYLNNLGAEFYNNEGVRFYTKASYNYQDLLEWKGTVERFINQSDSSVAYYNSEFYGHNKRKGYAVRLECFFYDSGLSVGAYFVRTSPIDRTDKKAIGPSIALSFFVTTNNMKI